jgi:hypothetical protein
MLQTYGTWRCPESTRSTQRQSGARTLRALRRHPTLPARPRPGRLSRARPAHRPRRSPDRRSRLKPTTVARPCTRAKRDAARDQRPAPSQTPGGRTFKPSPAHPFRTRFPVRCAVSYGNSTFRPCRSSRADLFRSGSSSTTSSGCSAPSERSGVTRRGIRQHAPFCPIAPQAVLGRHVARHRQLRVSAGERRDGVARDVWISGASASKTLPWDDCGAFGSASLMFKNGPAAPNPWSGRSRARTGDLLLVSQRVGSSGCRRRDAVARAPPSSEPNRPPRRTPERAERRPGRLEWETRRPPSPELAWNERYLRRLYPRFVRMLGRVLQGFSAGSSVRQDWLKIVGSPVRVQVSPPKGSASRPVRCLTRPSNRP